MTVFRYRRKKCTWSNGKRRDPKIRIRDFSTSLPRFHSKDHEYFQNKMIFNSTFITKFWHHIHRKTKRKKVRALITLTSVVCFALSFKRVHENRLNYFLALIFSKSCFRVSSLLFVNSKGELVKGSKCTATSSSL
jgi:hypothetical protein